MCATKLCMALMLYECLNRKTWTVPRVICWVSGPLLSGAHTLSLAHCSSSSVFSSPPLSLHTFTYKHTLRLQTAGILIQIDVDVENRTCFVCNIRLNKIVWPRQVFFIQNLHKRERERNSCTLLLKITSCHGNLYLSVECSAWLTFFWHLGHIHMPLGGDLSGGCKQSRW